MLVSEIFFTGDAAERTVSEGELVEMIDKLSQFWQRIKNTDKAMLTL